MASEPGTTPRPRAAAHGSRPEESEEVENDGKRASGDDVDVEAKEVEQVSHEAKGLLVHPVLPPFPNPFCHHQNPPFHDTLPAPLYTPHTPYPLNRFCADPAFPVGGGMVEAVEAVVEVVQAGEANDTMLRGPKGQDSRKQIHGNLSGRNENCEVARGAKELHGSSLETRKPDDSCLGDDAMRPTRIKYKPLSR